LPGLELPAGAAARDGVHRLHPATGEDGQAGLKPTRSNSPEFARQRGKPGAIIATPRRRMRKGKKAFHDFTRKVRKGREESDVIGAVEG